MRKTQLQLPDPLYREVKRIARERDWPLAEVLRRGAEYMVRRYPRRAGAGKEWRLPRGQDLGAIKIHYREWREIAHEPEHLENSDS